MSKETDDINMGFAFAGFVFGILVIFLVLWSPVSYYTGKWNDYWDTRDEQHITISNELDLWGTAQNACAHQVANYLHQPNVPSMAYASSTSGDFSTYDCYGVQFTKIPKK